MEMQERGWRGERTIWTRDTMGRAVPVSTGLTKDSDGRLVAAIAIGDGPSAIIPVPGDDASKDLRQNVADALGGLGEAEQAGR